MTSTPPRALSFDADVKEKHVAQHLEHAGTPNDTQFATTKGAISDEVYHFGQMSEAEIESRRKALVRKVDFRLLPLLTLMYFMNFVDRSNLANARLGTLEADLGMTGNNFQVATSILFVGYLLFQLPSNLFLTKLKPSMALSTTMLLWGLVSLLTAWAQSYHGLIAVRFFLGIVEAPFFPGCIYLMSSWYSRKELGTRYAWFYAGAALANSFNGLLSALVLHNLHGTRGIAGWRWLYIIEGALTMGIALAGYWLLPNYPRTTPWLSEEEQHFAAWRLAIDAGSDDEDDLTLMQALKLAVKDYKMYLFMLLQHLILLAQGFQYVFPSIVKTLGYSPTVTSLLTAPPWIAALLAGVAATLAAGRSDRRGIFIICSLSVSAVGYLLTTFLTGFGGRYVGMFFMCMGVLASFQVNLTWISNSFARPTKKRAACIAIVNLTGNSANCYVSFLFPTTGGPTYRTGCLALFGVAIAVILVTVVIQFVLRKQNRDLDREEGFLTDDKGGEAGSPPAERGYRYLI